MFLFLASFREKVRHRERIIAYLKMNSTWWLKTEWIVKYTLKNHCDELSIPVLSVCLFKDNFSKECDIRNIFGKE